MATILMSMAGEGRGHATRARSMVEELSARGHRLMLFCPGDAYDMLAPVYEGTRVKVVRIPGLLFVYGKDNKLNMPATLCRSLKYLFRLPSLIKKLSRVIDRVKPDLIITDFEPALPRAAEKCKIPYISINHQHFMAAGDLSEMPFQFRFHAWYMGRVVNLYYWNQVYTIVSGFFFPPVRKKWKGKAEFVGGFMRPEILAQEPYSGDHVLAYLRKFSAPGVMEALRHCGLPVKLYGLGEQPADGNITYCPIDPHRFVEDLARCRAVVCTAGNQLLSETLYYGKPVYALPESGQWEQTINAWYIKRDQHGEWADLEAAQPGPILKFLNNLEQYSATPPQKLNGLPTVIERIEKMLSK
jgi:uncharacterized protein (TIGR00661 family)